jgi:hypothetical protein
MLALLPEVDGPEPRVPRYNIVGPRLNITQVSPELAARIRAVELGQGQLPTLKVDAATNRLVILGDSEQALADWLLYVLGGFSTCIVRYLEMKAPERSANAVAWAEAQRKSQEKLLALLDEDYRPELQPFDRIDQIFAQRGLAGGTGYTEYPFEDDEAEEADPPEEEEETP